MADTVYLPDEKRTVRLGRIRPKVPPQALQLRRYLKPGAVPPPASVDYATKAKPSISRMYLNDTYGDCVIAGKMHQLGVWSGNDTDSGGVVLATDREVSDQYFGICGPGDNGCVITDVLDYFQKRGLQAGGKTYTIDGYVAVDWTNKLEVQVALYLFGSLTLGINLPGQWTEGGDGSIWDVTNSRIVGGHDVCAVGYNDQGVQIATWGGLRTITWRAFTSRQWIEEVYAQLAPLWYGSDKLAPSGVDVATLKDDLSKLGSGVLPPIPDPTPPPPPLPPVPPPVPPIPPSLWQILREFVDWVLSFFRHRGTPARDVMGKLLLPNSATIEGYNARFGLTADATLFTVNWQDIVAWIEALLKQYGPVIVPEIHVWIDALPVGPVVKWALHLLVNILANQLLK